MKRWTSADFVGFGHDAGGGRVRAGIGGGRCGRVAQSGLGIRRGIAPPPGSFFMAGWSDIHIDDDLRVSSGRLQ